MKIKKKKRKFLHISNLKLSQKYRQMARNRILQISTNMSYLNIINLAKKKMFIDERSNKKKISHIEIFNQIFRKKKKNYEPKKKY